MSAMLNLGSLKNSKVEKSKKNTEAKYEQKDLAKSDFGLKTGKNINLPKGNPPINK